MSDSQLILKYFPDLATEQVEKFARLESVYAEWNPKINVISRKDMDQLYLHHVLHSLAIAKVIGFKPGTVVLDVGTGGGFPGIPLAILFPEVRFHLVDSVGKKIKVVNEIIREIQLHHVTAAQVRAEDLVEQFDFVVTRAVASLQTLHQWVRGRIHSNHRNVLANGIFCLKGGDLDKEIQEAGTSVRVFELSSFFEEDFFKTKKLLYMPV